MCMFKKLKDVIEYKDLMERAYPEDSPFIIVEQEKIDIENSVDPYTVYKIYTAIAIRKLDMCFKDGWKISGKFHIEQTFIEEDDDEYVICPYVDCKENMCGHKTKHLKTVECNLDNHNCPACIPIENLM